MPGLEIRPFGDDDLAAAAALLADRHRRHRAAEPLLPEIGDFAAEIAALRAKEGASGVVGLRDGRVVAYLLGTRLCDEAWGPNVWVELAGHAADDAEDIRDLYAVAAAAWVEAERTAHYAWVPASEADLVEAWFRLGFGQQQALGIREVPNALAAAAPNVRLATEVDVDALVALAPLLDEHQALAPVFSRKPPEDPDELRAEILEDLGSSRVANLVAEENGRLVGNFVAVPVELSSTHAGLARPARTALLGWAATLPEARGTGAGLALTDAVFAWARSHGYETVVADWRTTNLSASRFWPRRGFRTTFLRLHRLIP
jgi:GNAT superfamily N-acetyltransferase